MTGSSVLFDAPGPRARLRNHIITAIHVVVLAVIACPVYLPFFDPGPNPHGTPPIWLAAVGEGMAETAGRVADGVIGHGCTPRRHPTEADIPAITTGRGDEARRAATEILDSVLLETDDVPGQMRIG